MKSIWLWPKRRLWCCILNFWSEKIDWVLAFPSHNHESWHEGDTRELHLHTFTMQESPFQCKNQCQVPDNKQPTVVECKHSPGSPCYGLLHHCWRTPPGKSDIYTKGVRDRNLVKCLKSSTGRLVTGGGNESGQGLREEDLSEGRPSGRWLLLRCNRSCWCRSKGTACHRRTHTSQMAVTGRGWYHLLGRAASRFCVLTIIVRSHHAMSCL